jgi:hypothetical protein
MEGGTMRGSQWLFLTGSVVISVLGASAAYAGGGGTIEGGTITFVGTLVEPTCGFAVTADLFNAQGRAGGTEQPNRRSCSGTASTPANASRTYSSSVVHLSNAEPDQVLRYFAGYVRAAQASAADPVLLTQTYD